MQPSRDNIERTPTVVYYCDRASRAPIGAAPGSSRGEMNFEIPVLRCQERFEQYFYYSCAAVIVSLPLPPAAVVRPKTKYGVIFGSWSRGKACEWSDIDLLLCPLALMTCATAGTWICFGDWLRGAIVG